MLHKKCFEIGFGKETRLKGTRRVQQSLRLLIPYFPFHQRRDHKA